MSERVHVEELETTKPRTRELRVTVEEDTVRQGLQKVAKKVSRELRIPGFRPGKAPYPIVERYVGREYLMREFLADEIESLIKEALVRADIHDSIDTYLLDVEFERPSFLLEVALEPKIDLGDYMSIRIPFEEPEITDEDVDKVLADMLRDQATYKPVEGPLKADDLVDVVLTIRVGDEVVVDKEEASVEVGTELYLPGLSDKLVGATVGETLEFDLPIPEEHAWRKHGEEAHITLEVKEAKRLTLPELTLELAQELNPDVESVEELREIVRENLAYHRRLEAQREYRQKIMEALEERAKVEYPPLMVDNLVDEQIESMRQYAKSLGLEWDQYLSFAGKTEEQLREELRSDAERELRQHLILQAIADEHKIEPTDEDWHELTMSMIFQGYTMEELDRRMREDENFRRNVFREVFRIAVLNFMSEVAQGKLEGTEESEKGPDTEEAEHPPAEREETTEPEEESESTQPSSPQEV